MDRSYLKSKSTVRRFPFVGSDKLIYAMDGVSPFMIHYIIEGKGRLNVPCLTQAIGLALDKTPILKSIARLRWFAPYWEVIEDFIPHSILTVSDLSEKVDGERVAQGLIERFINEYIDITQSAPARFLLIQLSEERWIFVVKAHHVPVDAVALFHVAEDIRNYYEKLLKGETIPPFGEMGDRSRWPLFHRVSLFLWCHVVFMTIRQKVVAFRRPSRSFVQFSASKGSDAISYRSLKFKGKDYTLFRSRCKSMGITTNELVLVALCRTIHKWNGDLERPDSVYSIIMPVDLRRYARHGGKIPRIMASFIGGTEVVIPAKAARTLDEAVKYVTQETRFIKNHHMALLPNLIFPLLYFVPPRWLRRVAKRLYERCPTRLVPTSIVTNIGKADRILLPSAKFAIKDIEGVATAYSPAGLFVAPISYLHQQTITITYRKGLCSDEEIDAFVDMFSEEILPVHHLTHDEKNIVAVSQSPSTLGNPANPAREKNYERS